MSLGQADFRDSRRRRVLNDEARRGAECLPLPATEGSRYTEAANVENHPQITQFIPRKYRSYALALTAAALGIAAIVALHFSSSDLAAALESPAIGGFDLAVGGGLAAWFAALLLVAVAVVAWMIYSLRRHRVDDYKARYRLWLWIGLGALLASADSVAHLHVPWSNLWARLTGFAPWDGAVWWLAPVGLVASWLTMRLITETAECRGACCFVVVSVVAYATALLAALGVLASGSSPGGVVVTTAATLTGHCVLLAGATLYARYVVLDVQGLIVRPVRTPGSEEDRQKPLRGIKAIDPPRNPSDAAGVPATLPISSATTGQAQKIAQAGYGARRGQASESQVASTVDSSQPSQDELQGDREPQDRKLSKAERKRLRKQQRRCA